VELWEGSKGKIRKGRHAKGATNIILLYYAVFILYALNRSPMPQI
jgi:hypothetical protein